METSWKLIAKTPTGQEQETTDEAAIFFPKGTVFTRVRTSIGKPETEPERKTKYLDSRKKNSGF
jgi:hypothetical protein